MKRLFAVLLVLLLVMSMAGCTASRENVEKVQNDYTVTGSTHGFGDADEWTANSSIKISVDTMQEELTLFGLDFVVDGSEPLNALVTADETSLHLYLPELMDDCYTISYDTIADMINDEEDDDSDSTAEESPEDAELTEELKDLGGKYFNIILSVANKNNTSRRVGIYELEGLGEKQLCASVTCKPEADDWRAMLKELFTTAKEDDDLMEALGKMAVGVTQSPGSQQALESYGIDDPESAMTMISQLIDSGIENVDNIALSLDGMAIEIATGTKRVYALKATVPGGTAIGYESYGKAENERKDAIVMYTEEGAAVLALNTVRRSADRITGNLSISFPTEVQADYVVSGKDDYLKYDIRLTAADLTVTAVQDGTGNNRNFRLTIDKADVGMEMNVKKEPAKIQLLVPEYAVEKVILTEDDLNAALSNISEHLAGTDFALKLSGILNAVQTSSVS